MDACRASHAGARRAHLDLPAAYARMNAVIGFLTENCCQRQAGRSGPGHESRPMRSANARHATRGANRFPKPGIHMLEWATLLMISPTQCRRFAYESQWLRGSKPERFPRRPAYRTAMRKDASRRAPRADRSSASTASRRQRRRGKNAMSAVSSAASKRFNRGERSAGRSPPGFEDARRATTRTLRPPVRQACRLRRRYPGHRRRVRVAGKG